MPFLLDVILHGLLPIPDVLSRYKIGEISAVFFVRALLGRLTQDEADRLDDDDPERHRLLEYVGEAEEWFQRRFSLGVPSSCRRPRERPMA
jgi:hypothetical protein